MKPPYNAYTQRPILTYKVNISGEHSFAKCLASGTIEEGILDVLVILSSLAANAPCNSKPEPWVERHVDLERVR